MKRLRLILGDQLNGKHSWFSDTREDVTYLMAEMRQETDYVVHHIQKVVAFFLAMRHFAEFLKGRGHRVIYLKIGDAGNKQGLEKILRQALKETGAEKLEYQWPDEYRLDEQLKAIGKALDLPCEGVDSEHFYTHRNELAEFFKGKKQIRMETFYRMMRKKHHVLTTGDAPQGGQWNFDKTNRKKWTGKPEIPHERGFRRDVSQLVEEIKKAGIKTMGTLDQEQFSWPVSREDSLSVLRHFCKELLPHFGDYQDAMHSGEQYLFHSRLSFALNSKMLSPREVVDTVVATYEEGDREIHISQVEGFVRQVLGWREYIRGIYWREMPGYKRRNTLRNQRNLPKFYWTGETKMHCLQKCIGQSLETAYAHHIQRLMVTGNFALLAQVHPDEVDQWYLGIYIDAIEWVELPNTRGMSQYADGGLLSSKPYISSANYINKMSNYCKSCSYSPYIKTGQNACPFNSLYWHFLNEKKSHFADNPRMGLMLSQLEKLGKKKLSEIEKRAREIIKDPDNF